MKSQKRARGKKSPRWEPAVEPSVMIPGFEDERPASPAAKSAVEVTVAAVPAPTGPVERDDEGRAIDWSNPDAMRKGSAHAVILWFVIPLIAILLYGIFVR